MVVDGFAVLTVRVVIVKDLEEDGGDVVADRATDFAVDRDAAAAIRRAAEKVEAETAAVVVGEVVRRVG